MKQEIENAVAIADAYRNEHEGEIPVLVIAHAQDDLRGELQHVYVGVFRNHKNHIIEDQKMFCSVMRMAFAMNNVYRYEFLVKPEFNYAAAQMTKNVLAVVAVNQTETETTKTVEWFEIEDDGLTPYFSEMPVEGMFTQLLPTDAERNIVFNEKTITGINAYLDNCTYNVPEVTEQEDEQEVTGFEAMLAAFS